MIAAKRRVNACLRAQADADEAGEPTLAWSFDDDALTAEAAADGWCALLTNLDPPRCCAAAKAKRRSNAATPTSKVPWP